MAGLSGLHPKSIRYFNRVHRRRIAAFAPGALMTRCTMAAPARSVAILRNFWSFPSKPWPPWSHDQNCPEIVLQRTNVVLSDTLHVH
jgi:hypothetical protein